MNLATVIELTFWSLVFLAAMNEAGFVLRRRPPFLQRKIPGVIGRLLVTGMARAYAKDNGLTIDFDGIFSGRPLNATNSILAETVCGLQHLIAGSWASIYVFAVGHRTGFW